MARSIVIRPGDVEIASRRHLRRKVFQTGDGKVRAVHTLGPIHWNDQGAWVDVNDTPTSVDGKTFTTASTPYIVGWQAENLSLIYQSKLGGDITITLAALDGVPYTGRPTNPSLVGNDVTCTVAPELDIRLRFRSHGVEIYKILRGPSAPNSLSWAILAGDLTHITFDPMTTSGRDNYLRNDPARAGDPLNGSRTIEMTHVSTTPTLVNGKLSYEVTETFTGRTRFIDPITKARSWVNEVSYPVEIDVTVNESVVANADDGRGLNPAYWVQASTSLNVAGAYAGAWRFQSVDVPQAATIDSATLTVNVTSRGGSGSAPLSGEDVDDAAAWANLSANSPLTMAATTANTSWSVPATTGIKTIDCTAIIQEIVDRAGWAANQDMRVGFTSLASIGAAYAEFEDYSAAGTAEGELEIVYTPSGANTATAAWFSA